MKSLVVAAALSLLTTSALAAPPDQSADTQPQAAHAHSRFSADDAAAMADARLAALKAGLKLTTRATEMTKIADSAKPLYDSLDESQKRRFGMLMHQASSMHRQWGWRRHRFGDDG